MYNCTRLLSTLQLTNTTILRKSIIQNLNNNKNVLIRNRSTINLINCKKNGYICASPYDKVTIPETTIDKYVWKNMRYWSDKIATVCVATGRKYTFGQLRDASAAFAINLQRKFNLQQHDVMAVCLPNVPEYPIVIFGAHEAGLTTSLMNPIYKADEIARQLAMCNTKIIICTPLNYSEIKKACKISKINIPIISITFLPQLQNPSGSIDFFEMINTQNIHFDQIKATNIKSEDIAVIPFSSGTTGLAKGVVLTHRNIVGNCEMIQAKLPIDKFVKDTTDDFQDVIPCFLPFFHIYGLTICMLSKLHLGCQLVTFPQFTPQDLIKAHTVHKGTLLNLAPPVLLLLTNSPNFNKENFPHLRIIMTGAAPIGLSDAERFLDKFPQVELAQGYGLTETSPASIITPVGNKQYESVGFPVPNTELKIISYDESDLKGLEAFKSGELCVRGPQVMKGYLNNDEANSEIFLPDNWLRTGDIAHYDNEGYFYITDRIKELIKVKGFQVPPAELEELLRSHPKIMDAAVFGINDAKSGEAPRAIIVPKSDDVTEIEILNYVKDKVAPYKQLSGGIVFVKEIPKSAAGKILRRELKQKYAPK